MRLQYSTLVMAGIMTILARPLTAQMPIKPSTVRSELSQAQAAQGSPATPAPSVKPAASPKAAAAAPSAKPAAASVKPAAPAPSVKPAAAAKAATAPSAKSVAPAKPASLAASAAQAPAAPAAGGPKRDPFNPLLSNSTGGGPPSPDRLPPGKAGLMVGTLRLDGLVHGPNGMVAVVSNPQQRVYFLHEGDHIFDGQVLRITMEAVSFQQTGRDAFGNSLDHEVTRRLYPNPGEQR